MEAVGLYENKQIINAVLKQLDKIHKNNIAFQMCVGKNKSPESFLNCRNKVNHAFEKSYDILKKLK